MKALKKTAPAPSFTVQLKFAGRKIAEFDFVAKDEEVCIVDLNPDKTRELVQAYDASIKAQAKPQSKLEVVHSLPRRLREPRPS